MGIQSPASGNIDKRSVRMLVMVMVMTTYPKALPKRTARMALMSTTTDPTTLQKQATPIAKALNAIAASPRPPFTMRTEEGRFHIQKAVYLLRYMDYPPARRFEYNLYLMGPYSPDLATCYYQLEDEGIRSAGAATDVPEPTLVVLREALAGTHEFLEGLTTLLDLKHETPDMPKAYARARSVKAHLDDATWKEVREFLRRHAALTGRTSTRPT